MSDWHRPEWYAIACQAAIIVCLVAAGVVFLNASSRLTPRQVTIGLNAIGISVGLVVALAAERWRRRHQHGGRATRKDR